MKIITRPDFMELPDLPLPIYARSTGHYRLDEAYSLGSSGNEHFVEIVWGIRGSGKIDIADETFQLLPGDVVWKLTDEPHVYHPLTAEWELRWITFDGPNADAFMQSYGYPRRLEGAGPCPEELFREIEKSLREMSPYSQRRMISSITAILALAGRCSGSKGDSYRITDRFITLAQSQYPNENTNVNTLADVLGLHRATLTRHFQSVMMMSPGEYLSRLRIQEAFALLNSTSMPINEIAVKVGIPNPCHFSRAIKNATGYTPKEIRQGKY